MLAESPFCMALATSLDQRSPQRLLVTSALSAKPTSLPISLARSVMPAVHLAGANTARAAPPLPAPRWMWPGSGRFTLMLLAMQPTVLPQPTTPAMVSSFMQFCNETMKPPGARY